MKALSYITVLLVLFNILFAVRYYFQKTRPVTLTQEAIQPSIHLVNSKLYFEEDNYKRSIKELKRGIDEIQRMKSSIHPESRKKVYQSLEALKVVYNKAATEQIPKEHINEASVDMLLSLTYCQVKAAQAFAEGGNLKQCRQALRFAMYHIKNALILSEGTKKDYEVQIYAEMNEIVKNYRLSSAEMVSKMDQILIELETSGVTFS